MESLFFLLAYFLKGFLPWGKGSDNNLFKKDARSKCPPEIFKDFFVDVDGKIQYTHLIII